MKNTPIQWHPGFVAAMNLEMADSRSVLSFHKEYNLNTKPLEIDLLIIKKADSSAVTNEIGRIFRGHNILEYKSPADHLDIDVFYKTEGYACLYKSYGEKVNSIKEDDVTITLIRAIKPAGLFRYFRKHGYQVSNPRRGIYYIEGKNPFPAQVIVTKELEPESHIWLKSLSGKLEKRDMQELHKHVGRLKGKLDMEFADSVLEVVIKANTKTAEKKAGGDNMLSDECLDIMRQFIDPKVLEQEKRKGLKTGIQGTVDVLRDLGHGDFKIKTIIQSKYGLSENEADEYLLVAK